MKHTLARVCNATLGLSEADWIIIYPFLDNKRNIQLDTENISYAGELKSTVGDVLTKKKPSPNGMTTHIIAQDGIYISDVAQPTAKIGNKRIEDHQFIAREGVKAMIGMCEVAGLSVMLAIAGRTVFSPELRSAMTSSGLSCSARPTSSEPSVRVCTR